MVTYEADGFGKEGRSIILEERIEMKSLIYVWFSLNMIWGDKMEEKAKRLKPTVEVLREL